MTGHSSNPLTLLDTALASLTMPVLEFAVSHHDQNPDRRWSRRQAWIPRTTDNERAWSRRYTTRLDGHLVQLFTGRPAASESPFREAGVWNPTTRPVVVTTPSTDLATKPARGLAAGQPDFRASYRDQMDVLLTIAAGVYAPRHREGLSAALVQLTTIAGSADLAVTFVRAPSSAFSVEQLKAGKAVGASAGYPHLAWGSAVRITVGLDDSTEAARLKFLRDITAFARHRDHGYGLHVSSQKPGHTRGDWARLVGLRDLGEPPYIENPPQSGLLVTLIGPERQGSYAAVAKLVTENRLQVSACSAVTWNDIMFIQLSAISPPNWKPPNHGQPLLTTGPGRGCIIIASSHELQSEIPGGAPLYATWQVRQPPREIGDNPDLDKGDAALMTRSCAVVDVLKKRLTEKLGAGTDTRPTCRVDLERHRPTGNGRVSGRIKAVVWPPSDVTTADQLESWLGALCGEIQRQVRLAVSQLAPGADVAVVTRLRVDWRQRWLDTWQEEAR